MACHLDQYGPRAGPYVSMAAPTLSLSPLCKQRLMVEQCSEMVRRRPLFWRAWGKGRRGGFGCLRAVLTSPVDPDSDCPRKSSSILPDAKTEKGTARGQTVVGGI